MTRVELAKQLGIPRTTLNNYIKSGCDISSVETAAAWIKNHKREPLGSQDHYEASEIDGKDSEARFQRLVDSEAYVSGQIRTLQENILPNLVSMLCDDPENRALQAKLSKANQDLIAHRKSLLSISKLISDIEFKKAAQAGDTVPVAFVKDVITNVLMNGVLLWAQSHGDGSTLMYLLKDNLDRIINSVSERAQGAPIGYNE